jgi:UDP-N-acetylmuramoyl-tripeptide--D-alanyl-D-alanine ligase
MISIKEYCILILLSILPFIYKYLFWFFAIQLKEYRFDRFLEYLKSPQWFKSIFHFWTLIEFIILIYSFYSSEVFLCRMMIAILSLENIYIFSKIFKRKIFLPKTTSRFLFTSTILILIEVLFLISVPNVYLFILVNYCFTPIFILVSIIISLPVVSFMKSKKFRKATEISKKFSNVIKIWITWSYWKTSQKEFLTQFLETKYKVLKTPKNVNTELWVSDVIINELNNKYDFFVAEMWAYKIWEIRTIWNILNHKYGFITAIWSQHLALFWGIKKTMEAKNEIAEKVLENKWILYINRDNKIIKKLKFNKRLNVVRYWTKKWCDARSKILEIEDWMTKFEFYYKWKKSLFKTNLFWTHNIVNITWVIAFCIDIWINKNDIKDILKILKFPENTLSIIRTYRNILLDDTYNISEWWLLAWLEAINSFQKIKRRILIIDDILELWKDSKGIHYKIAKKIAQKKLAAEVVYVWVNYKTDFVAWLIEWWMKLSNIHSNLDFIQKGDVLLFEWRKARFYLNKFLWKK